MGFNQSMDKEGKLTDEGHETALTGDVLIKEVDSLKFGLMKTKTGKFFCTGRSGIVKQFAQTHLKQARTKHIGQYIGW